MCKFLNSYEESLHLGACKLAKYERNCIVFWKIYTADKNFTRPPAAPVGTNSNSVPQHSAPHVNCPEFHTPWCLQSGTMYLYMSYEIHLYVMKIRFNTALSDQNQIQYQNYPNFLRMWPMWWKLRPPPQVVRVSGGGRQIGLLNMSNIHIISICPNLLIDIDIYTLLSLSAFLTVKSFCQNQYRYINIKILWYIFINTRQT